MSGDVRLTHDGLMYESGVKLDIEGLHDEIIDSDPHGFECTPISKQEVLALIQIAKEYKHGSPAKVVDHSRDNLDAAGAVEGPVNYDELIAMAYRKRLYYSNGDGAAIHEELADALTVLQERVAELEDAKAFRETCIATWTQRAEKAEAERDALRQRAEWTLHNCGLIHEWAKEWRPAFHRVSLIDWLRNRIDAAIREGK